VQRPVSPEVAEQIGHYLSVIGQPVRLRLIDALERQGELPVKELAKAVGVTAPDASQHLAVLHGQRVVTRRKEGRNVRYALADPVALGEVSAGAQLADRSAEGVQLTGTLRLGRRTRAVRPPAVGKTVVVSHRGRLLGAGRGGLLSASGLVHVLRHARRVVHPQEAGEPAS
jgi:DNA-binding transcriptional ArsR family regulator